MAQKKRRAVIVTNTTFKLCPWADALYAMDRQWWNRYARQVKAQFKGACYSGVADCYHAQLTPAYHWENSGAGAIALAAALGAERITLLGYDCQHSGGKTHWHGDHPEGLGNAGRVGEWAGQFQRLAGAKILQGVTVINATRQTALESWPQKTLEQALCAP